MGAGQAVQKEEPWRQEIACEEEVFVCEDEA